MRKWLVYGTGKSGIAASALLLRAGEEVVLYDEREGLDEEALLRELPDGKKSVVTGAFPEAVLPELAALVVSPGVPVDTPFFDGVRKSTPVIGEVELAFRFGSGKVFAITGTNGKTTTTALLGRIFSDYTNDSFTVGNIGIPYTSVADKTDASSMIALEVSSFQLETAPTFRPHGSAILNITEDHLNRHHTMEEYIRVKEEVARNQTMEDFCVLNYEDPVLRDFGEQIKDRVRVIFFSSKQPVEGGIWLAEDRIVAGFAGNTEILRTGDLRIIGTHNYENAMAAIAMAYFAGIPVENIRESACAFTAVPHRIEWVRDRDGVAYYNDSKGTNPDAAIKAIEAMSRPTLLIGGGYDKGSDYRPWIRAFDGKVKYLVLEGVTREAIREAALAEGFPEERIVMRETMLEALAFCMEHAQPGDAVLLSPACASWGEFKNFEERGDIFRAYVCTH